MVVVDYYRRFVMAEVVASGASEQVAEILIGNIFAKYGAPNEILNDRGKNFRTEMLRAVYARLNIHHIKTLAYHPQTNRLTERLNRKLNSMLSIYVRIGRSSYHSRSWLTTHPNMQAQAVHHSTC